ncbi:MAG: 1-deoxy-D-xylulose-5-phosphate synthase [Spirochaetes bacterium]|nr:1-deoxy-D-xylulose-5-phosphate synthase [Spirochaetota bacterium]
MLESIKKPSDLKRLNTSELNELAAEIRNYMLDVVSVRGGHIASSLGVVELTLALHYVFNTPKDKIIWDVGHQCYAHKIITGRKDAFRTIRTLNGLSGFPKPSESVYDTYCTGHSSTSLSLAIGEAVANDLLKRKNKVLAVIGDGSIGAGMAFEALNQIGHLKKDVIIILNDNEHSISKNVGALGRYLMKMITDPLYNKMRKRSFEWIKKIPRYGNAISDFFIKVEEALKGVIIPGLLFEELGIRYFGPVDGHNIEMLIEMLSRIKHINSGPKLLHIITKKGKGYEPAENNPPKFHGIGPFNRKNGICINKNQLSFSDVIGKTLAHISTIDKKVVAITAAMKLGTGLSEFEKAAGGRLFDVGIAEQHAVTFAGALASNGLKPFISIYSTFLQRAIDQLIHDIGIMKMPIKLLIDRAGIVGDDGETHHGLFDISIIKNIPNFIFLAPSNGEELRDMLYYALDYTKGPIAIRYPRGSANSPDLEFNKFNKFLPGKIKQLSEGKDLAILAVGDMVETALKLNKILKEKKIGSSVVNILSIKPLDLNGIEKLVRNTKNYITLENGYISGGIGEYILSNIHSDLRKKYLLSAGFPDEFISHGKNAELFKKYNIDAESLCQRIVKIVKEKK